MAGQQQKVSVMLTGSVDEQTVEELRGPLAQQAGSPNMIDSRNTRLSVMRGTCVRMPDVQPLGVDLTEEGSDLVDAYGIVSNAVHRNYALYTTPDVGNRVVAEDGYSVPGTDYIRDRFGKRDQNAFVPLHLSKAGAIANKLGTRYPMYDGTVRDTYGIASSFNPYTGEHWVAWSVFTHAGENIAIWAACYDERGTLLAAPQVVLYPTSGSLQLHEHIALTAHGSSGTRLWVWGNNLITGLDHGTYYHSIATVGTDAVLGPSVRPSPDDFGLSNLFAVTSDGGQYAYLAGRVGNIGRVYKVNIDTGTVATSVDMPNPVFAFGLTGQAAISYQVINDQPRVAVAFSGTSLYSAVYDGNLAVVLPQQTRARQGQQGPIYAQFVSCPRRGLVGAVFAASYVEGYSEAPPSPNIFPNYTEVWIRPLDGSADLVLLRLYGAVLIDHGATWQVAYDECYPLLFVSVNWGEIDCGIAAGKWEVFDQQIVGYTVGPAEWPTDIFPVPARAMWSPIARFGTVRGVMSPAYLPPPKRWVPAGSGIPRIGDDFYVPYRKSDEDTPGRWVKLSVTPQQPITAHDRDGVTIASGALPVQWDGVETFELGGPLTAPQLRVVTGGAGALPAGSYGATVIYEWRDGAGLLHRSMPAPTLQFNLAAGSTASFRAPEPLTMRYGRKQQAVRATLYMTRKDGTSYHEIPFYEVAIDGWFYANVTSEPNDAWPIIYSRGLSGEELVPQPPPPLRDVAIVGTRMWGIDAEIPTRLVYSKHRIAGVGFEWVPALEVLVPSNAGEVVALCENNGTLIAFAERAIFQIADGGPNNTGQGGGYGSPYKLTSVGTRTARSVLRVPQGVLFLDNAGAMSLLTGGQVLQLPGSLVRGQVVGSFVLENAEEACFVITEGSSIATTGAAPHLHAPNYVLVFNYALSRFTVWDLAFQPSLVAQSAITRDVGLMYAPETGRTYTIDSNVPHPTALMQWETDWFILGGDFQDYLVAYDILFNAHRDGPHSIALELLTEYEGTVATTSRAWSDAELEAIQKPNGRYTVRIEPVRQDARAMKVRIFELSQGGNHRGCRPGALTIIYSVDGITYEESNIPGSMK